MQIRISRRRRSGKIYEYAQLVESYRRPSDGMPMHRVIANLGPPGSPEVENLKAALNATRLKKPLVVAPAQRTTKPQKPKQSLRYLDLAVLLDLWRQWQLDDVLNSIWPHSSADVPPSHIVAALTMQRCTDPRSKLYAERWFPRTALPELLGVNLNQFNNTRLHRVLDALDDATPALMAKLPSLYRDKHGAFAALFIDVTDTWFVGNGPPLAEKAKTKEGHFMRKVGIVLLCNKRGYPLRWQVINGKTGDANAMTSLMDPAVGQNWLSSVPLVCDRAMGYTACIQKLLDRNIHFVTALVRAEFDAYTTSVPHHSFVDLHPTVKDDKAVIEAMETARATTMTEASSTLFWLDLGVVEHGMASNTPMKSVKDDDEQDATLLAIRWGRRIKEAVDSGQSPTIAATGRSFGIKKSAATKYCRLARQLCESIQQDILAGKAKGVSLGELLSVVSNKLTPEQQHQAFDKLVAQAHSRGGKLRNHMPSRSAKSDASSRDDKQPVRVRAVLYFNPEIFVEQRYSAQKNVEAIETFVSRLNNQLLSKTSKKTRTQVASAIENKLRSYHLLDVYKVSIDQVSTQHGATLHADVQLDTTAWSKRRRHDGFSLLVTHPDLEMSAQSLCQLYRSKDTIESDFQIIKSLIKIRPVRHRTDAKVRAHVTLCMLALLLDRTLNERINAHSAQAALELLQTCALNRYGGTQGDSAYLITEADADQLQILKQLGLTHLVDDEKMIDQLTPR